MSVQVEVLVGLLIAFLLTLYLMARFGR